MTIIFLNILHLIMMMMIAAEMWTSERPGAPGHHAAKDQEGKLAHAGYYDDHHQYDDYYDQYANENYYD